MTETTPLDAAHAAMEAAPDDDAARLRYYERLAETEMVLLLEREAAERSVDPVSVQIDGTIYVLAFDREERLTAHAGGAAPYAALSGRIIARMLAGQGIGLAVNPGEDGASFLLPPEAVDWLDTTLAGAPEEAEARAVAVHPPRALPEILIDALSRKLASAAGLASHAVLAEVEYTGARRGHLLAVMDAREGAEGAIAGAVREALVFSGLDAGELDVAFFAADDPMAGRIASVGLRFDLPVPEAPASSEPKAPGRDPDAPPILR